MSRIGVRTQGGRAEISELPEGWATFRIADVFSYWGGMTPSKSNRSYWGGKIPWISSKDVKKSRLASGSKFITAKALRETRLRLCEPSSVLVVVRSGILANTLPVTIAEAPLTINQDIKAFHSSEPSVNEWLALGLKALEQQILTENRKDGTTVQSIRFEEMKDLVLPIPPIEEQKRIKSVVERLVEQSCDANERLIRVGMILKRLRQSALMAACSGRLTADWRGTTTTAGGELPPSWHRCSIGSLFTVRTGGTPSRKVKEYYTRGTIPWVKTAEVQNGDIKQVEEYITRRAVADSNAKVFPAGTLLVAMYGEGKTRGQVGRLTFAAATNQACAALIGNGMPRETNEYVFTYLRSQYQALRAEAVGGNQPNLNLSIIKGWEVPLPPIEEQREIVRRVQELFSLADAIEAKVSAAARRVGVLPQVLLGKAIRGELVPTEAELARRERRGFETASEMLKRMLDRPDRRQPRQKAKPKAL